MLKEIGGMSFFEGACVRHCRDPSDLPGSSRSAPDSIIGILIFKYPSNHHRPLIQLNFFRHILQAWRRKYFPVESSNAKQDGATTVKLIVSFPIQFFGATFKVTFSSVGDPTPWNDFRSDFQLSWRFWLECWQLSQLPLITTSCHATLAMSLQPEQKRRLFYVCMYLYT